MEGSSRDIKDEPDIEPGPELPKPIAGTETPPSPRTAAAALRKDKARVRFNSNAAAHPPTTASVPPPAAQATISKPRPSLLRGSSAEVVKTLKDAEDESDPESKEAMVAAQERARIMAANIHNDSSAIDRDSLESSTGTPAFDSPYGSGIPLQTLDESGSSREGFHKLPSEDKEGHGLKDEAFNLVRAHTMRFGPSSSTGQSSPADKGKQHEERTLTELNDGNFDGVLYDVPAPEQYRGSVLSQLLKLYKPPEPSFKGTHHRAASASSVISDGTPTVQGTPSGASTPKRKWYDQNKSQDTLANLIEASSRLANPVNPNDSADKAKKNGKKPQRPGQRRTHSANRLSGLWQQQEARITVHIAETLARQDYIIRLCRALMLFGAPTHRLEEYLSMTARVLEIDGQFLYLPGCMIISFDDKSTHTTEVRIVRTGQGIDLGKLKDVHLIYKEVMHDVCGVEEAAEKLDTLMKRKDKFHKWLRVVMFGVMSVTASPFSFGARLIDLPLIFAFGCLIGVLQLIVAPNSALYSNVFEVSSTIIVSFLARTFGSIKSGGEEIFCFGALAQGGIVMLLPGYMVLCSALELQSRAIVPGSIRIVYAVIYSLLLGFGITVGAALYGLFNSEPSNTTTCPDAMNPYYGFIFVPPFVISLCIIYQAKWRQMPVMVFVSFAGYMVNYWSGQKFKSSPQISSTLGALAVGLLANLYSRIRHGVAAAILIPAVFCQVPGSLASTGGLLSGLQVANSITNASGEINGTSSVQFQQGSNPDNLVFSVAASMIQIAIGIAVGLFMSSLLIYPLGKRRSALFSF
ncbi:Ff.00g025170.m01.CDS01 [Fusarium sp. VM40]|nr:Ff.00g025170.m01.CDS01 [Fusarium sp. VM40]